MNPMTDLWRAATYIERDGARRVTNLEASRLGLETFEGPMLGGAYRFYIRTEDVPALDEARDRAYSKYRSAKR